MGKHSLKFPLIILDLVISFLSSILIFILFTGGKIFYVGATPVRLQGIENPLTFLYLLIIIRYLIDRSDPFLGIHSLSIGSIISSCDKLCRNFYLKISNIPSHKVYRVVVIIIGISLVIKMLNSYHFYGFFSGDDVEIHEMTFAHLFDWDTKAWNLRSPFFPMVFIFPIQAALLAVGIQDPFYLIFAGRMIVVLFSVLNLYLVYVIATKMFNSRPVGILSMFFLSLSKLHTTMGSSELPRTVASTFIILCFLLLLMEKNQGLFIIMAGAFLAIGASIRFGEVVFIVPAVLYLIFHKRLKHGLLLVIFFASTFALINYISDQLYWGQAFFSLKNIIDYTIVQQESSRGFQPLIFYILSIGLWSNYFSFGLMFFSLRLNSHKIWIWVFAPIILLSLIPHKEPRYLLPVLPFFCIMVGLSTWSTLNQIYQNKIKIKILKDISKPIYILSLILFVNIIQAHKDHRFSYLVFLLLGIIFLIYFFRIWKIRRTGATSQERRFSSLNVATLLTLVLFGIFLFEINGFFFHRSESGVEMARFLYKQPDNIGVAIDDIWRSGGKLYVYRKQSVRNIDQTLIRNRDALLSSLLKNPVDWVGIRDKYIRQYGYDTLLNDIGYKEVKFSNKIRLETYRLFKQRK